MRHAYYAFFIRGINWLPFARKSSRAKRSRHILRTMLSRRALSVLLIVSLLVTSTPAAPSTLGAVAGEWKADLAFWSKANDFPGWWYRALMGQNPRRPKPQEKQEERDARIARIEIQRGKGIVLAEEQLMLSAIAFDHQDVPVGGVSFEWRSDYQRREQHDGILPHGAFSASVPGQYVITAAAGGLTDSVTVNVLPKLAKGNLPLITRRVTSDSIDQPAAEPKGVHRAHARPMYQTPFIDGDPAGWNSTNKPAAFIPQNERGETPGRTTVAANSNNFRIEAPVINLPGRGIDLNLNLVYNSRVWSKSNNANNEIMFNADRDLIAPGWSLGFVRVINMVDAGAFLIEPDGTRHSFAGNLTTNQSTGERYFYATTNDGSFIEYGIVTRGIGTGTVDTFGMARFPDGKVVHFGGALSIENSSNIYVLHTMMLFEGNGNYIFFTYNTGRLRWVTDTLGRVVTCHYDSNQLLTAITAAGLKDDNGNVVNRTLIRLHYKQLTLNATFNGLVPVVTTPTVWVPDAIYYPATRMGQWFGESDSYSSYGMIKKVREQKSMTFSDAPLTEQGTFQAGTTTREIEYDYPAGPANLTDAPAYDTVTETWEGSTSGSAVTQFEIVDEGTTRKVTTTLPDLTKSIEYSHLKPGQYDNGLVYKVEVVDGSTVLQTITTTWESGYEGAPRVKRRDFTNVHNQTHYQTFGYTDGINVFVFNQVAELNEFGYDGLLIRKTKWKYRPTARRLDSGLPFNPHEPVMWGFAVTSMEVFAADGTKVFRTEYEYDNYQTTGWFHPNPYNGNILDLPGPIPSWSSYYDPFFFTFQYMLGFSARGNITGVVIYPDAANPASAITTSIIYDKTGNVRKVTTNGKQNTFNLTLDTKYAYPTTETIGSSDPNSPIRITTSSTYDFNTGLKLSAIDGNSRPTQYSYYPDSWRLKQTIAPTGANTLDEYDDIGSTVTSTTKGSDGTIAGKRVTKMDGRGQPIRVETLAPGTVWDLKETQYDDLGRITKASLPYRTGQTPVWRETSYDALNRVTGKLEPDQSESRIFYNEPARPGSATTTPGDTARSVDAWGRERWVLTDALSRQIEVVEPNPNGNGSVLATGNLLTKFSYDPLGNLTQIDHDQQQRRFRYDSFSRLTHQKLAEADATLDNSGVYVGSGTGQWSQVFSYDTFSNLNWSVDARGVKTIFTYNNDPLDRLQSITYDTSGAGPGQTIHPAPSITYDYVETGDLTRMESIVANGVSTETFDYDSEGRLKKTNLLFANGTLFPALTEYTYDSLDRISDLRYPVQYGLTGNPRKLVHNDYDVASRVNGLKVDGADYASEIIYNAANQTTSVKVGSGTNQITETYDYEPVTSLLSRQRVQRGGTTLLDLNYGYLRQGTTTGRTGQLTTIINNLNANKNRNYTYDALGRLKQATGGSATAPIWTQDYTYDRYGNRSAVSSTGSSAWNRKLPNQQKVTSEAQVAQALPVPTQQRTQELLSHHASRTVTKAFAPPSPPVFTDDPLNDPQNPQKTIIKAVHITELRDAIDALRGLLGLSAYSWEGSVSPGGFIKRDQISQMRTALDQALGAPAGGYSAGLTVGLPVLAIHIQELRDRVKAGWATAALISRDGYASLAYSPNSNRITTTGFEYDAAGNQTRVVRPDGLAQSYEYDVANRLVKVRDHNLVIVASYTYADGPRRLMAQDGDTNWNVRTYYVWGAEMVLSEYTETAAAPTTLLWSRNYVYMDAALLATQDLNGSTERVEFHHADRLGTTRLVTRGDGTWYEQVTLPFGVPITTESSGASNRRFTTYDRNTTTKLDYAFARSYDWTQARFTQVDPIGMAAVNVTNPQTLNLYAYCANDPINAVDPSGTDGLSFSFGGWTIGFGRGPGAIGGVAGGFLGGLLNFGLGILGSILGGQGNTTFFGWNWAGFPRMPRFDPPGSPGPSIVTVSISGTSPEPPRLEKVGFGRLEVANRNVIIAECQGIQVGIVSDVTRGLISYSAVPTTDKLNNSTKPQYGRRQPGDDRGHIIGYALGGPPKPKNLIWQNESVNRGAYETFERHIRENLTRNKDWKAYVKIVNYYPKVSSVLCLGGSFRPTGGSYTVWYKTPERTFFGARMIWKNTAP